MSRVGQILEVAPGREDVAEQQHTLESADLAGILASAMDAIIAIDEDQRVVLFNPAAERIFGCSAAQALGASIERFIPERFREKHRDHVRSFIETGVTARRMASLGQLHGLRSNGEEFPIEASIAQTKGNGGRLLTVILRDISEKILLGEQLDVAQKNLENLVQNTPGMVYRCLNDRNWTMRYVSAGARDLTGYAPEELLDGSLPFGQLIDAHDRQRVWDEVQVAITAERPFEIEYRLHHRDGTTRWVSERGSAQEDDDGHIVLSGVMFDVTARRRAQDASERLSAIVASSDDAIIGKTLTGEITSWNPAAERMLGYTEHEVVGQPMTLLMQEDQVDEERKILERIASGDRVDHFETTRVRKDGAPIDVSLSVSPIRDPAGAIVGASTIARDITEAKRAETALRESEQRLRAMVENLPAGAVYIEGDRFFLNQRAEEITGYSREELPTRELWGSLLYREEEPETLRRYLEDRGPALVHPRAVPLTRKDGERRLVEFAGYAWDRNEVWLLQDVTDADRAAAARASLSRILEESLNEIYVFRASDLRFIQVNRGARENLGYTLEELRDLTPLDLKSELTREQFEAKLAPLRTGAVRHVQFETIHVRKDGTRYPVEVHLYRGPYEGVESFVAVILDITERRAAVNREREAERRAHRLESLASISTLTAGIAHDVGAPMTAILGYAEMMEKSLSDEKNRQRAHIIVEQVQRISQLVQALLNMARPGEQGFVSVELHEVLDTSLEFYREKLRSHGVVVERSIDPVPPVAGNPDRLQQVFLSLIINAVDAMPEGGALRVGLSNPSPDVVEVRLRDTGAGIAPENIDHIFEPFYTTKERGRGTGLGLVVAKGIIEEHAGEMTVESAVGVGTEFVVRIPAVDA